MRRESLNAVLLTGGALRVGSVLSLVLLFADACSPSHHTNPQFFTYRIIDILPHDQNAFTQGLVFDDGFFYESTGRYGSSSLRKVVPATGAVVIINQLSDQFFGEGLTIFGERIIQLTWRSRVGFVYAKESGALLQQFSYPTEGWGITHDGQRLIMSDGTEKIHFLDPGTFEPIGHLAVHDRGIPVTRLNELEYIKGEIYANVWGTDRIARIDPQTGKVVGWILLDGLLDSLEPAQPVDVLNGIAYDPRDDRIFVTGKLWPNIFQIKLVPVEHP